MGSEGTSEFVYGQDLYYPSSADYYGYYCTGTGAPDEWDDHNNFFGLDGQDLHYPGLQAEGSPYMYYTPNYGYAQSSYNPYNPYIPGSVIGHDGSSLGTHEYFTDPTYHQPISSPYYVPVVLPSGADIVQQNIPEPLLYASFPSFSSKTDEGVKASATLPLTSQRAAYPSLEPSRSSSQQFQAPGKLSKGSLLNFPAKKQSSHGAMPPYNVSHVTQASNFTGSANVTEQLLHGRIPSGEHPSKANMQVNSNLPHFGPDLHKWVSVDKFRLRTQSSDFSSNSSGRSHGLNEHNRGARTNRASGQWTSTITVRAYTSKVGISNPERNIIISVDQYNKDDFPVEYPSAKFFIIKSYSEDDVHKSIKYNIWSSTPNGNKKLNAAYEDAQRLSVGEPLKCPVFLFFSVNGSGQFCGVAEMIGPVDFQKDMDFWQQDKWTGSFPVKWHIIKDVSNASFRQIVLENNENKPVTHSRDTQEITYIPGTSMLKIFKNSPLKESILDDFLRYEELEKNNQERRSRLFKSCDSPIFIPTFIPPCVHNATTNQYVREDNMHEDVILDRPRNTTEEHIDNFNQSQSNAEHLYSRMYQPLRENREQLNSAAKPYNPEGKQRSEVSQLPKLSVQKRTHSAYQPLKVNQKQQNDIAVQQPKIDGNHPTNALSQVQKEDGIKVKATTCRPLTSNGKPFQPSNVYKKQSYDMIDHPRKGDGKKANGTGLQYTKADNTVSIHLKRDREQRNGVTVSSVSEITLQAALKGNQVVKPDATNLLDKMGRPDKVENLAGRIGSLLINSTINKETDCSSGPVDVVTVGSMHIRVKKPGESLLRDF
ncbi:YTH domain-containing protein ECT4-like [Typha latifolia]|uniref:YTH domain-containing protein ECT4-like n=1 Tax=Typha latifolia TaxID=4733 RepID=UPI003C2EBC36